ncbi:MAG: hypothetical protein GY766_01785, partial [Herbaspirillum sp.]|uniref:hypothetical protein n=1 Tax=Herbaspirillum sp. TaxID=1890675 RepID=UPI0025862329
KMGVQYTAKWDPFILEHPLLFYQNTAKKTTLDRLVTELNLKSFLPQYRVYHSRFEVIKVDQSELLRGSYFKFKANDSMNHIVGDGVTVDTRCFAETEYLINGQSASFSTKFLPFFVREITARNVKLFGDRIIWTEQFADCNEDGDGLKVDGRPHFADSVSLTECGVVSVPVALSDGDRLEIGQYLKCFRGGQWRRGSVSRMLSNKVCVRFGSEDQFDFEWVERAEFAERLRFTYFGEEKVNEHVFTVSTNAVAEDEELRKSKQFEFGDLAD